MTIDEIVGRARKARSLMTRTELVHLCKLAEIAPDGTGVEVGVYCGASLIAWSLMRAGRGKSIGVDDWTLRNQEEAMSGAQVRALCEQNLITAGIDAELLNGNSVEMSRQVKDDLAFVFIDGDHYSPFVDEDIAAWTPKIKRGGVVVFHDYGVRKFDTTRVVAQWAARERWRIIGDRVESTLGFMRP